MTDVHEWLAANERDVPSALAEHLRDAVPRGGVTVDDLVSAGVRLLRTAVAAAPMTRAQALDVLGADALLTYAFEAAADEPRQLAERADAATRRIAALAEEGA